MIDTNNKPRTRQGSLLKKTSGLIGEKQTTNLSQGKESKYKQVSYNRDTKETLSMIFNHPVFKIFSSILTLYALYADDLKQIIVSQEYDYVFTDIIIALMCFFILEIFITFLIEESYGCSVFFWTDLIGALSLLLDIEYINDEFQTLFNDNLQATASIKSINILRFTKSIRSIRIIRLIKLVKLVSKSKTNDENHKLSTKFEELTLNKMIFLILFMLLSSVIFNPEIYWTNLTNMELSIQILSQSTIFHDKDFDTFYDFYIEDCKNNIHIPLVYTYINGHDYLMPGFNVTLRNPERTSVLQLCDFKNSKEIYSNKNHYRDVNITQYNYLVSKKIIPSFEELNGTCYSLFDNRIFVINSAELSMIKTTVILFIFACGLFLIEQDMKRLVFFPIEKMIKKIKTMSRNPVASFQEDTENQTKNKSKKKISCVCKLDNKEMIETAMLEKKISKICALLVLGFGEAGSQIISSVLQEGIDAEMNPVIPGKKIIGIYGFCDIRNFTDTTDVLKEKVMIFVNQVAEIVHTLVSDYCGSANKNIGDAFLLVWKFENKFVENDNGVLRLKKCPAVSKIADMALISFIQILIQVQKSYKLAEYRKHPQLNERMKNYAVRMGFGMHLGYSIEGAIGSMFKIDASYLSPHVNMANKLEEKTKEFGKELILSGDFVDYLSEDARKTLRLLDQVKNDSGDIFRYYTIDLNLAAIQIENQADSLFLIEGINEKMESIIHKRKLSQKLYDEVINNVRNPWKELQKNEDFILVRKKYTPEFMSLYNSAINHYIDGDWNTAKIDFDNAEGIFEEKDVPIDNFLNYMNKHNYQALDNWDGYKRENEIGH